MRIASSLILSLACTAPVCADGAKPTYADDVLPILKTSCLGCHNTEKQKGGLDLSTFAAAMQGGSSGSAIEPGQPDKSRLYTLTAHLAEPKMPEKADKIPQAQIDTIKKWIEQGARENSGSKVMAPKAPVAAVAVAPAGKGRPAGPPPMPGKLSRDPVVVARKPGAILALAASPWAPLVAIGGSKQVLLYNTDTSEFLGVLPFPHGQINCLRFSRDGKLLLAAGGRGGASGKAVLYDLAAGKAILEVGQETDAILSADLSADRSQIAVGSPSKFVRVYATADGSLLRELKKHTDWVTAVEYSPDGVLLASGDRNGGVFVWETAAGRDFHTLRGPTAAITGVSWRDDGNALAVSSEDGTVRTFEMNNGTQVRSLPAHPGGAESVHFAHDGRTVTLGRDRVPKLWDANGNLQKQFEPFADLGLRAALSHDGSRIVAGDLAGSVKVWTTADAKQMAALDANPPPAAERLKRAEAAVAEAEAKLKQATDAMTAAKAAADKANAELGALGKAAGDAAAANKAAQDAAVAAKADADKQGAAFTAASRSEAAKAVTYQAFQEAANKVAEVAGKDPQNADMKAQAVKAAEIAKAAQVELDAAKKASVAVASVQKAAAEKLGAAQKAAAAAAATAPAVQQKLTSEQAARKPVFDAQAAAQTNLQTAQAALDAAKVVRDREKAAK